MARDSTDGLGSTLGFIKTVILPTAVGVTLAFVASQLKFHAIFNAIVVLAMIGVGVMLVRRPNERRKPLVVVALALAGYVVVGWLAGIFTA